MDRILRTDDIIALNTLVRMCERGSKVARVREYDSSVIMGVARSIGDESGNFVGRNDDVRDAFMRVTGLAGFDYFWPIADLVTDVKRLYFVEVDR